MGDDSMAAWTIMEVPAVDDDSGNALCHFFDGKFSTISERKTNMTPNDIVKESGYMACVYLEAQFE